MLYYAFNVIYALKPEKWHTMQYKSLNTVYDIKSKNFQNMHYAWICTPKGQNMQTCTEKVSLYGVVKSWNKYLQSLTKITSVDLSYMEVILFYKIFYVLDVVYVKSNSVSC